MIGAQRAGGTGCSPAPPANLASLQPSLLIGQHFLRCPRNVIAEFAVVPGFFAPFADKAHCRIMSRL